MGSAEPIHLPDTEAFERMRSRMLDVAAPAPPHVHPWALATNAILVTDRLSQPDMLPRVEALGRAGVCDPGTIDDLRAAARALLHATAQRGEAVEARRSRRYLDLISQAALVRQSAVEVLDELDSDEVRLWLDVFRLPSDDAELTFDLRAIALLYDEYAVLVGGTLDPAAGAAAARSSAEAIERSLWGERAGGEWSLWVARAFSLTLLLYREVQWIGQTLRGPDGVALAFPSPAGIARSARRSRGGSGSLRPLRLASSLPPTAPPMPGSTDDGAAGRVSVRAAPARVSVPAPAPPAPPPSAPAPTPTPTPAEVAPRPSSEAEPSPPPDSSGARRRFDRLSAELEVSLVSDSNFYVGFTENLSEGGLFVATYFTRPLGSRVEMSVRVPGRDEPLVLRGIVRWLRDYSPTSDGHPGMGIQFDSLSETDKHEIADFLSTREPLFYAE